jgi:hypothetical protein
MLLIKNPGASQEQLKNAHAGNAQVQARLFETYRRESKNFTHLPGESKDAMFQLFTVILNNMRANVAVVTTSPRKYRTIA